jgi:hypothetical protein
MGFAAIVQAAAKRHSMRERPIAQLSYPEEDVDNALKTAGIACARFLDKARDRLARLEVIPVFRR